MYIGILGQSLSTVAPYLSSVFKRLVGSLVVMSYAQDMQEKFGEFKINLTQHRILISPFFIIISHHFLILKFK